MEKTLSSFPVALFIQWHDIDWTGRGYSKNSPNSAELVKSYIGPSLPEGKVYITDVDDHSIYVHEYLRPKANENLVRSMLNLSVLATIPVYKGRVRWGI